MLEPPLRPDEQLVTRVTSVRAMIGSSRGTRRRASFYLATTGAPFEPPTACSHSSCFPGFPMCQGAWPASNLSRILGFFSAP